MSSPRKKQSRRTSRSTPAERLGGGTEIRASRYIGTKSLRIIGGDLRRRSVTYNGDRATRPMKDSVRENLFNILGPGIKGTVAWDLFAGTGILAIEALSRGAVHAIAIDSSRGCTRSIRQSADALSVSQRLEVLQGDTFRLAALRLPHAPDQRRVVFCCPPYRMWESHQEQLFELVQMSFAGAAAGSIIVCEMDRKCDPAILPEAQWDIRQYGIVTLAFAEVISPSGDDAPSDDNTQSAVK